MVKTNEIIKKAIEINYQEMYHISESKKKKLIDLMTMLACRFYIEDQLDSVTIEELIEKGNLESGLLQEKKTIEEMYK